MKYPLFIALLLCAFGLKALASNLPEFPDSSNGQAHLQAHDARLNPVNVLPYVQLIADTLPPAPAVAPAPAPAPYQVTVTDTVGPVLALVSRRMLPGVRVRSGLLIRKIQITMPAGTGTEIDRYVTGRHGNRVGEAWSIVIDPSRTKTGARVKKKK